MKFINFNELNISQKPKFVKGFKIGRRLTLSNMLTLHTDDKELEAYKRALLGPRENLVLSNKFTSCLYFPTNSYFSS